MIIIMIIITYKNIMIEGYIYNIKTKNYQQLNEIKKL